LKWRATIRHHRSFSKRAIVLSIGLLCVAGPFAGRAFADMQNGTFYSGSAFFKESHHDEGNGLVGLWDVEVRRVLQFKNVWEQICDYQAEVKVTLPQGKVFDDVSSFHEGCNPNGGPAWFTFPQFGDKDNTTTTRKAPSSRRTGRTTTPAASSARSGPRGCEARSCSFGDVSALPVEPDCR